MAAMNNYDTLIRVSKMNGRKASADSTMTLTDQRTLINGELARVGGRKGKAFEALDQSGFTVLESPVIEQILARVESGESKGLVLAYGDRLARNAWSLGGFFSRMAKAGGEIHDASMPGIDYRTPEGRQLTMMRGVSSEGVYFAAKRRGDNVADQVVARGVANAVPYGYRRNAVNGVKSDPSRDAKALVPDPGHAAIVRKIFAMRLEGQRIAAIVRTLNDAGVPSPRGKRWTDATVETIVRNEVYTGVVKLGQRRNEGAHKPLVSKSDWRKVQATRGVTLSGTYKAGLAGGLVVCSGCGRPLGVAGRPGRLVYSCRGGSADGACPRRVYVSKGPADAFVLDVVVEALDSRTLDVFASTRELDDAKAALAAAQASKADVLAKADVLTKDELEAALLPKRAAEEAAQQAVEQALMRAEEAVELPKSGSAFLASSETAQRRTARSLIERIVVSPPVAGGTVEDRLREVVFTHGG
jgi:DNA invertase Pin-like site-specific DNA recombinase